MAAAAAPSPVDGAARSPSGSASWPAAAARTVVLDLLVIYASVVHGAGLRDRG